MLPLPATMARCRLVRRVRPIMVSTTCSRLETESGCTIVLSLQGCSFGRLRDASRGNGARGRGRAAHVEVDIARQFNDCFGMIAVLAQRVFQGLRAVHEQPPIKSVLFLGAPLATLVPAD